jgi:osmoprotectant transport system ATP-binding protein
MLMDEPFGAIDPIARERLQNDFLRLHEQVQKTVIFVTHDIDEAIKMGHRIAVMRDGHLVQIATADELLAHPADEFVANFVGADRGIKRLRVRTLHDIELGPARSDLRAPSVDQDTSLHLALSMMLSESVNQLNVTDGDGKTVGTVGIENITQMVSDGRVASSA